MRNIVIGIGGGGSHLLLNLIRLEKHILLVDGDTLEKKNLDRQLFDASAIGMNKAQAAVGLAWVQGFNNQLDFIPEYFSCGAFEVGRDDLLWCCADNHACRREVLDACDIYGCKAIIAANEYTDFEAYYYETAMRNTPNDPRVFYPDILTDRSGDPLGPPGCVEAAKTNRQLVIANSMAAEMALWLYWHWFHEAPKLDRELLDFSPVHHRGCSTTLRTIKWQDRIRELDAATA